jgi:hypothetical protein
MNTEMAELKRIFDVCERAGFTIMYFFAQYYSHSFTIVIKSASLLDGESKPDDYENEPASAIDIANLFRETGYEIIKYEKKRNVVMEYSGTIYLEIGPEERAITSIPKKLEQ